MTPEPPGLIRALGVCILFYCFAIPGELYGHFLHLQPITRVLIAQLVAWPPTLLLAWRTTGRPWKECFAVRRFPPRVVLPTVIASAGVCVLSLEIVSWIPMSDETVQFMQRYETGNTWVAVIATLVIAPVAEEFLFRGWMLRGFLARYYPGRSILLAALVFAVFHFNPWQAVPALAAGVLLGWVVLRSRSVLPAVIGHAAVNSVPVALGALLPRVGYANFEDLEHLPPALDAAALVLLVIGALLLRRALPPVRTEVADVPASGA